MRRTACAAAVCFVVAGACGGGTAPTRPSQPGSAAAAGEHDPLAITAPPNGNGTTLLTRLDPDTLAPRPGGLELGEYHDAWSFSPDRRRLAIGTFGRTGVRLVDPLKLTIIRDVPLPVAAEGVGWIGRKLVAVLLQRGGVVVVDADRGRIVRRWRASYAVPCGDRPQIVSEHGVVFAVAARGSGAVRLVRVDRRARIRTVTLRDVRTAVAPRGCAAIALAAQPGGRLVAVAAARGPLVTVDLRTLAITRHARIAGSAIPGARTACDPRRVCVGRRTLAWIASDRLAVGGVDWADRSGTPSRPRSAGVALVDTGRWSAQSIDGVRGDLAVTPDGTLLTFGGGRAGLRAFDADGTPRWTSLRRARVHAVSATATRVYALEDDATEAHVLDAATGAQVASYRSGPALGVRDVLDGRSHAGR